MTDTLCKVNIDLAALRYNYRKLCTHNKPILAVIKSNAYGHGLLDVASTLQEEGEKYFAVGTVDEALKLRQHNIKGTIISLLGCLNETEYDLCETHNICPSIHNHAGLHIALKYRISVAIKVNTGMARLGFDVEEMENVLMAFQGQCAEPAFIFSHLVFAEDASKIAFSEKQSKHLQDIINFAKNYYPNILSSLSNSSAIIAMPNLFSDILRPGIALYGGNPLYQTPKEAEGAIYQPVMSLDTSVLTVRTLKKGQSLSYGESFTAKRNSVVAWVGIGYADGYRRISSSHEQNNNGLQICIHNIRCPVIGRINMQMCAVDITEISTPVYPGEIAHILNGCSNGIKMEEIATCWDTIPHDVVSTLGK